MPRVVPNQRERFENDELFRKLSRDMEVRYTGYRDRPSAERRLCLQAECREGHASIAVVGIGLNLNLNFSSNSWNENNDVISDGRPALNFVDFDREPNKVHLKSRFILNGVCVSWRGWIDLRRLDGVGRVEFDSESAEIEEALLRGTGFRQQHDNGVGLQHFNADRQRAFCNEQFDRHMSLIQTAASEAMLNVGGTDRAISLPPPTGDTNYVTCYDDVSN